MKKTILYILIMILVLNCQKAVYDNIGEGLTGYLLGVREGSPDISISGNQDTMDEGSTLSIGVKLSKTPDSNKTITITSDNAALLVNGSQETTIEITTDNATVEQTVELSAIEDGNTTSETVTITFTGDNLKTRTINITINDTISRSVQLSTSTTLDEETTGTLAISLGIQPEETVQVTLSAPSQLTLNTTTLSFTPENFSTPQSVTFQINDTANSNPTYTITATSNGENSTTNVQVIDNDFVFKDISAGQSDQSGYNPSLYIDSTNDKIFIATRNDVNNEKLALFKCDLNGDSCEYKDASTSQGDRSGIKPHLALSGNDLLIATSYFDTASVSIILYKCTTDFSVACSNAQGVTGSEHKGYQPKIVINGSIINVFGSDGSYAHYYKYDTDLNYLDYKELGPYALTGGGYVPRGIEHVNSQIYIAYTAQSSIMTFSCEREMMGMKSL